jgi:hypothetical protein
MKFPAVLVLIALQSGDAMNADFAKKMARARLEKEGLPDPICRTGIISLPIGSLGKKQACCPAYCKECDDYKTCESVRGQESKNACCASSVLKLECGKGAPANICLKKCSEALPPCIMEDGQVWKLEPPKVNAADDCNEAISEWRQHSEAAIKAGNEAAEAWEAKIALETLKKVLKSHKKMVDDTKARIKEMKAEAAADEASLKKVEGIMDLLSEEIKKAIELHDVMAQHLLQDLKDELQHSTDDAKDAEKEVSEAIAAMDSAKDELLNYLDTLEGQKKQAEDTSPKHLLDKEHDIELVHGVAEKIRNLQFVVANRTGDLETDLKEAEATAKKAQEVVKEYLTTTTTTTFHWKGVFTLKSKLADPRILNVEGNSMNNGGNCHLWNNPWHPSSQWRISGDQGHYTFENIHSGKFLNVQDDSTKKGGNIHQWDNPGNPSTQWTIAPGQGGSVLISNQRSGMLVNIEHNAKHDGANIHQWNNPGNPSSQWYLEPLPHLAGKKYTIKSVLAGKYLNVAHSSKDNGADVWTWHDPKNTASQWTISGEEGKYILTNVNSGKVLNVEGDSMNKGGNIQQWDNPGSRFSQWTITKNGGAYLIANVGSGMLVNIEHDSKHDRANIHQWDNPGDPSSQWFLEEIKTF